MSEKPTGAANGVTEDQLAAALIKSGGLVSAAAQMVGRTSRAVQYRIKGSQRLTDIVAEQRELQLDMTEAKLFEAISKGQAWAICFYLKCCGKKRGYIEQARLDVTGQVEHVHHDASQVHRAVLDQLDNDPRWLNYARESERADLAGLPVSTGDADEQGQLRPLGVETGETPEFRRGQDPGSAPAEEDGNPTF